MVRAQVRTSGSSYVLYLIPDPWDVTKDFKTGYTIGSYFKIQFKVTGNTLYVYYNSGQVYSKTSFSDSGAYFKAGCYNQSRPTSGTGEVKIKAWTLYTTH